ncbi:MAG: hypothetical protein ACXWXO_13445 [Nocardioides sp.]
MLGPLPTFYRVIVSVCALVSFIGIGAWLGHLLPETVLASVGTGIGAGLGVVAIMLLVHDFAHPRGARRH